MKTDNMNKVVVADFGSQTTQLIIRRIREIGVYCEIIPHNNLYSYVKKNKPQAIVLSGGPASSFEKNLPNLTKKY